jgi:two-component system osmolarity sensor histidine kinase EnvZ
MPGFKPSGATEIRDTARAVLDMRDRLRASADQRTAMLAAISHDLRTPLTRLKLQLALMEPTPDTQAARTDLAEMAQMLDEYLAFARGEEAEIANPTRIDAILADIVAHATPGGLTLTCTELPETTLTVRPLAVKRAVRNLVENALHHARSHVALSLKPGPRAVDILIDDDGPGIAPERHEEAFRPFVRLDAARNQNVSGVGLGLALARDVARAHGGDIRLEVSPQGGLRARLRLPL